MFYIVLLIVLGALFLVAELLLLSGSVVGTLLSLVCYGSAIFKAYADYGTTVAIYVAIAAAAVSLIVVIVSLRTKTWQKLSLAQEIESSSMVQPEQKLHVGDRGVTVSRLSPMGKVEIDGTIYEAKSIDSYIDPKCEVEITGFENFNVVVRKIN